MSALSDLQTTTGILDSKIAKVLEIVTSLSTSSTTIAAELSAAKFQIVDLQAQIAASAGNDAALVALNTQLQAQVAALESTIAGFNQNNGGGGGD